MLTTTLSVLECRVCFYFICTHLHYQFLNVVCVVSLYVLAIRIEKLKHKYAYTLYFIGLGFL